MLTNVGSTKEVIDLCTKLKAFDVLLHVSTAYSNPPQIVTEEKIYKSHLNPIELIELSRYLLKLFLLYFLKLNFTIFIRNCDQELKLKDYLGKFPNTYTFTKH